jgi:predicted metal-dependent enzyme (double-stranded beta helix superfamily)
MFLSEFIKILDSYEYDDSVPYAELFRMYMSSLNTEEDIMFHNKITEWLQQDPILMQRKYIRQPIYRRGHMELILLIWHPGSTTPVHSHPHYGCLMRVIRGYLTSETFLDDDRSSVYRVGEARTLKEGDIEYTRGQHGIHRISNTTNGLSLSLHLYIHRKPFEKEPKRISIP